MRPPGAVFTLVRTRNTASNKTVYGNAVWQSLSPLKPTRNTQHATRNKEKITKKLSPKSYRQERLVSGVDRGFLTELLGSMAQYAKSEKTY